ncbi:TetR/AcrR family transcriptional regulator [Rhodopseudomonas boonkerdii]|uniref:TetR/AcrR family transcriptional regulator n=1 Tax=Rhodopseudomonas boonkerdii TaxID=475937 RepID=UPI001E5C6AD1|nr:TetR/AcrR family transcriptional regulator [Rhodopseudomonas boonkerdii]UGV27458.1 TetR/AcrR family transcriptional regulator [Rhodopseudomonas boonkerdii]
MAKTSRIRAVRRPPQVRRKPATGKPQAGKSPQKSSGAESPYHHGDLHDALLKAAQTVLERDSLPGLTLRAVAREAGVSHAAPTHHFGDLTGLLSELAAVGFRNFNAALTAASATGATPVERALARARAYLAYARAQPGMYQLMFRTERLDMNRPALKEASNISFAGLAQVVGIAHSGDIATDALSMEQAAQIARTWSLAHGFAMLVLAGRLDYMLDRLPGRPDAEVLFVEALKTGLRPPQ